MFPNDGLARRRRIGEALARGDRPRWARARRTNKRLQMPPPLSAAQQAHEEMMAMQEWFDGGAGGGGTGGGSPLVPRLVGLPVGAPSAS